MQPTTSQAGSNAVKMDSPNPSRISTPTSPLDFIDRIPFKEIILSRDMLGSGSFGTVIRGRWRGRDVAVKKSNTPENIDSFLVEVKQLSCVKHPNIVTLHGASIESDTAYIIMEYAEGGSLNHLLHECKHQEYDLRHACSWAMQAARGVAYLHGIRPKPIMHRDLKPANLLLFSHGKRLKICDFGIACTEKTNMTNNIGSAPYMAPEVFQSTKYALSCDVYSWSIIFWETLVRAPPYPPQYSSQYVILWQVANGLRPREIESCPEPFWSLISRSWAAEPEKRPTMQQVVNEMEFIYNLTLNQDKIDIHRPSTSRAQQMDYGGSPERPVLPVVSCRNDLGADDDADDRLLVQGVARSNSRMITEFRHEQQSINSNTTFNSKTTSNSISKGLMNRIVSLQRRYQQLEEELDKKSVKSESFQEFEEIMNVVKRLRQEVKATSPVGKSNIMQQ